MPSTMEMPGSTPGASVKRFELWKGNAGKDWEVRLMSDTESSKDSTHVMWQLMNFTEAVRGSITSNKESLILIGMDPRLNMEALIDQMLGICKSGDLNVRTEMVGAEGSNPGEPGLALTLFHRVSKQQFDYVFRMKSEINREISDIMKEKNELAAKLETVTKQNSDAMEKIKNFESEVKSADEKNNRLENKLRTATKLNNKFKDDISVLKKQVRTKDDQFCSVHIFLEFLGCIFLLLKKKGNSHQKNKRKKQAP